MYQRDYMMRMILQLTEVLGQSMGMRRQDKQKQALELTDGLMGRFFRLGSKLLNKLSLADLLSMMRTGDILETEKALAAASLLKEEGDIYEELGNPEESFPRHVKALMLFIEARKEGAKPDWMELDATIHSLADKLKNEKLNSGTRKQIVLFYEQSGNYAKAEDELFRMLENGMDNAPVYGLELYDRLLSKVDDDLEAGGLPRQEVLDAVAELKQLAGVERGEA
jgi:tetratricopeptide (TPR) repeat protein